MTAASPRIGVISPYWSFWESSVEHDFKQDRLLLGRIAEQTLSEIAEIGWHVVVQPGDHTTSTIDQLDRSVHTIVVVSTMAAAPTAVLEVLRQFPKTPIVLWAAHEGSQVDPDFSHSGITLRGGTVGAPMIGASLARGGRWFDVVAGEVNDVEKVRPAVRRAAAAGMVRGARMGIIGETIPGYEWARVSNAQLSAVGVSVSAHEPEELADLFESSVADRSDLDGLTVDPELTEASLDLSLRYCTALDQLIEKEGLSAGAINCHVAALRLNPEIGIAPCFALGRSTSRGVPWTCTGDVATALAMLMVSALGDPTLYHEIEAIDEITNEVIIANSGEHDARLMSTDGRKLMIANPWFPEGAGTASTQFSIAPGPASLVGISTGSNGQLCVVVASGRFTGRTLPRTGTVNAGFVFDSGPVAETWARWCATGVGHHSCATDRDVSLDLEVVCRHLGLDFIKV